MLFEGYPKYTPLYIPSYENGFKCTCGMEYNFPKFVLEFMRNSKSYAHHVTCGNKNCKRKWAVRML